MANTPSSAPKKRAKKSVDVPRVPVPLSIDWPTSPEEWGKWLWENRQIASNLLKSYSIPKDLTVSIASEMLSDQQDKNPPNYPRISHVIRTEDGHMLVDYWDDDPRHMERMWRYGHDMVMSAREHEEKVRLEQREKYLKANPPPVIASQDWPSLIETLIQSDPASLHHPLMGWALKNTPGDHLKSVWAQILPALSASGHQSAVKLSDALSELAQTFPNSEAAIAHAILAGITEANGKWIDAARKAGVKLKIHPHVIMSKLLSVTPKNSPSKLKSLPHDKQVALWTKAWQLTTPHDTKTDRHVCSLLMDSAETSVGKDLFAIWWSQKSSAASAPAPQDFTSFVLAAADKNAPEFFNKMLSTPAIPLESHGYLAVSLVEWVINKLEDQEASASKATQLWLHRWRDTVAPEMLQEVWSHLIKINNLNTIDTLSHHIDPDQVITMTRRGLSASLRERAPLVHALLQKQDLMDAVPAEVLPDPSLPITRPRKRM